MPDNHDEILADADDAKKLILQGIIDRINEGETLSAAELKRYDDLIDYFKRKQSGAEVVESISAAARYCGLNERKVRYYLREARRFKIRQNADGSFDKAELDRLLTHLGAKDASKKDPGKDPVDARGRYEEARAKEKELVVARLRGELIAVEDVKRLFGDRAHELAKSLQLLARRISIRVAGKSKKQYQDVYGIIESEVNAILTTYSRPVESLRDVGKRKRAG